jgi:hypothetical protein
MSWVLGRKSEDVGRSDTSREDSIAAQGQFPNLGSIGAARSEGRLTRPIIKRLAQSLNCSLTRQARR